MLTVKQAAARLGITPQGVRKAVRERRLNGTATLLPSGRREYQLSQEAIDNFLAGRGSPLENEVETLTLRLEMALAAVHSKEIENVRLECELETARRRLARTELALQALLGEDETHGGATRGTT